MRPILIFTLAFLLLASLAAATIIPASLTEQKCGNGIREGYELCEPETAYDLCPAIGKILKIAMVCNEQTCACLPGESAKNCGNQIRESAEACDPGTKEPPFDICPNISQIIGLPLKCDTTTCDCVASGAPVVISYCGDEKVEGSEDCESTDDCPKGRECQNCTCVRVETELNISVEHNVTEDVTLPPTIEDITSAAGKTVILDFVIEDYVGEILPEELDYFDDEAVNIHVAMEDGSNTTVSLVTTEMVVQEIHPEAIAEPSMDIWVDEDAVKAVKAADNRTATITHMLSDGTIRYRPAGFWRSIWFFFFTPF